MKKYYIILCISLFIIFLNSNIESKNQSKTIPDDFKVKDNQISTNIDKEVVWFKDYFLDKFASQKLSNQLKIWFDRFPNKKSKIEISYYELAKLNSILFETINIGVENAIIKIEGSNLKMQRELAKLKLENAILKKENHKKIHNLTEKYNYLKAKYENFLKNKLWSD